MTRVFNFSAGPATLPEEVLRQAAEEMMDWQGSGMSVMEMSHRSREFASILETACRDLRELMAVPANYRILFMQGGATAQNAIIPMNLAGRCPQPATADFIHTGLWSGKSIAEAGRYCHVNVAASSEPEGFTAIPPRETWKLSDDAAYVHICSNETIHGVEYPAEPDVDIQSLADVGGSFSRIEEMRFLPIDARSSRLFAIAVAVPMVCLILATVPTEVILELLKKAFG
jgi:phosphoserine aminotransferase